MNAQNQPSPPVTNETIQRKGSRRTGSYIVVAVVVVAVLVIAGLYFGHILVIAPSKTTGTCASTTILGAGSTFVAPLMSQWAASYTVNTINYAAVGSGAGISQITAKTILFGASDAPLNASQAAAAPGLLTMPETAGAVAVIFNLPGVTFKGVFSLNLTGAVLAEIYMGTVTTWNNTAITSLNPGVALPSATINAWHRSDGSGTTYAFTQFLSDDSSTWKSTIGYSTSPTIFPKFAGALAAKGSSGIAGSVKSTPDSIGYVDLGYALTGAIAYAAVQNPSGKNIVPSVSDTASSVADSPQSSSLPAGNGNWSAVSLINAPGANDYPIATFSYLMFYQAADANPLVTSKGIAESLANWLTWTINQGQSFSGALYYVPLPASVVTADAATIGSMTYSGGSIPACT